MKYQDLFVEKYRPQRLDDMVLQPEHRKYFEGLIADGNIPNLLLYGKPGGGKTTLARILAHSLGWETLELNASDENGVDVIREKVTTFCDAASLDGEKKLIIFEEADGLSSSGGNGSSAQQILKNIIEEYSDSVRFIMTVNELNKMDAAIKSRMVLVNVVPPKGDDAKYKEIMRRLYEICKAENITFDFNKEDGIEKFPLYQIAKDFYPDLRKSVDALQRFSFNDEHKLHYNRDSHVKIDDIANHVIDEIIGIAYHTALKDMARDSIALRSYILSVEDSFGADYHLLMRTCLMKILTENPIPPEGQTRICDVVLEIQDRMKWYTMVLDKEIHFFAMVLSIIKILRKAKED